MTAPVLPAAFSAVSPGVSPAVQELDPHGCAIFVRVPAEKVVLFQAFFELYEGIAAVRTVDKEASVVCLLTTPDFAPVCQEILSCTQTMLGWSNLGEAGLGEHTREWKVFN